MVIMSICPLFAIQHIFRDFFDTLSYGRT
jgi:hypothetical protein